MARYTLWLDSTLSQLGETDNQAEALRWLRAIEQLPSTNLYLEDSVTGLWHETADELLDGTGKTDPAA